MTAISSLARASIRQLAAYEGPSEASAEIELDQNESPENLPEQVRQRIQQRLEKTSFNRYSDGASSQLRGLLSEFYQLKFEQFTVGAGIDELFYYLMLAFVDPGDKVVRFSPSFGMYKICAQVSGAQDVEVPLAPDFSLPENAAGICADAKLVFVCSPNNPTGNAFPFADIERIARSCKGIVCIDEAYAEFAGQDCLTLLKYDNVVIMRTFSKAFRAAGIRVGYAMANPELISCLERVRLPWNLSVFSQIAAEEVLREALADRKNNPFARGVQGTKSERERVREKLSRLPGIVVYPSDANFLLVRIQKEGKTVQEIFPRLVSRGVRVRVFSAPRLEDCLRVTIGKPEENDRFLQAIERLVTGNAVGKTGEPGPAENP